MRLTFLTGIWPPDVGGPATHGPEFARFLVSRGHEVVVVTMGDGEPAFGRARSSSCGARDPFPFATRGRGDRCARARRRRRALRDGDLRRCRSGIGRGPAPARRQARLRPGLRARAALRALRRLARGVPAARRPAGGGTQESTHPCACGARARSSFRAPTWRGSPPPGASRRTDHRASQPCAGGRVRRDARSAPGTFAFVGRLTRQKNLDVAIDAVAQVAGGAAHDRRRRPRPGATRGTGGRERRS